MTTSKDDNGNAVGPKSNTATSPEHGKTSKATEANQDNKMNKTNQGLPKVMIDINTLRYTLLSPSS